MAGARAREKAPKPQVATVNLYEVTLNGVKQRLTEEQYQAQRARAIKNILLRLSLIEDEAQFNRTEHRKWMKEVHGEHWYSVGAISDIVGDALPPPDSMWTRPNAAIANGRKAAQEGRLESAARQLQLANDSLRDVRKEWSEYMQKTIAGAETTEKGLEVTRDVSFAIAISAAAVVAAPVVAAGAGSVLGAGGLGLSGAALTGTTFVATGATITVGGGVAGGVLRGGSNLVGQAATGDKVNLGEAWRETKEGAKRGAVDAGSTFVGGQAGKALGLGGKGLSFTQRALRTGLSGGAGGAFGGGLGSALEGHGIKKIATDTVKGFGSGFAGGVVSGGVGHLTSGAPTIVRGLAETASGYAGGVGGAYISGERDPAKLRAAGTQAAIQSGLMGVAAHEEGGGRPPVEEEPVQQQQEAQQAAPPQHEQAVNPAEVEQLASKPVAPEQAPPQQEAKPPQAEAPPPQQEQQPAGPQSEPNKPSPIEQEGIQNEQQAMTEGEQVKQADEQAAGQLEDIQAKVKKEEAAALKEQSPEAGAPPEHAVAPSEAELQSTPGAESAAEPAKEPAAAAPAQEGAERMFTPEEVAEHVEQMFSPSEGQPDIPAGVESPAVKGGEIEGTRVRQGSIDAEGNVQRPGPARGDIEHIARSGNETPREAVARVNRVRGKAISDTPLGQAWEQARAKVLAGRTVESLGPKGALAAYKKTQQAFWKLARKDPAAVQFLKETGFELPSGKGAALLKVNEPAPGQKGLIVEERRLSLDHSAEKAIGDNWKLALDGDKLIFEFHRVNSFRDSIQRALQIGAYEKKTP